MSATSSARVGGVFRYSTIVGSSPLLRISASALRDVLRRKEALYAKLELDEPEWSDDQLIDHMLEHPILLERPIVVTPLGTRLCRPSEAVLDVLPSPQRGAFSKEDGEAVIDAQGRRIAR